jgi:hypothetical protein
MGLKRRNFLQQAGVGLLTLGLGQTALMGQRYGQVLADPTPRKLALLVGINQYPRMAKLTGCVTDIELQRELLIHRFGFQPQDILTLRDQEATREDIETAFVEHLIEQAEDGDVVVFHFSGYGSQIEVSTSEGTTGMREKSFVPVDSAIPNRGKPVANDISEKTLILLARSLPTKKVSFVLDTSYQGTGQTLRGNLRIRSCPNPPAERPSPDELAFQEKLSLRTQPSLAAIKGINRLDQIGGTILEAASEGQVATESRWSGFSAGLFTYVLTQHLWQTTAANKLYFSLARTAQTVERLTGQQQEPQLLGSQNRLGSLFPYFTPPQTEQSADGFVLDVDADGKTVGIHLTGLPVVVLENYGVNSRLRTENGVVLQARSRDGFTIKAKAVKESLPPDSLQKGQLVRESIRLIKRNPGLTVALDNNLQRIERVDATSAFANITAVASVVNAGEQAADCLFATIEDPQELRITQNGETEEMIPSGSYGLFSVGRVLIPNTISAKNEAVKSAINRLVPKLKSLLAAKLWGLTQNEGSSCLGLEATLEVVDSKTEKLIRRETLRTGSVPASSSLPKSAQDLVPKVEIGTRLQYNLRNYSDQDLYIMLVGIDSGGNAIALYTPEAKSEVDTSSPAKLKNTMVKAGETLVTPAPSTSFNLIVPGPVGLAQIYMIGSRAPFTKTLTTIAQNPHPKGEGERIVDLISPLDVAQSLLQDLHQASAVSADIVSSASDSYALDLAAWATFSFIYQVV